MMIPFTEEEDFIGFKISFVMYYNCKYHKMFLKIQCDQIILFIVLEVVELIILSMSFQGIRKIRENRKESPVLLESSELNTSVRPKPLPLNLQLKSSYLSNDIRSTRDSEVKADSPLLINRRTFVVHSSKEKDKKLLIGNFLHINLDQIPSQPRKESIKGYDHHRIPSKLLQGRRETRHDRSNSTATGQTQQDDRKVGLGNFNYEFVVGKGGFGKVWKVSQKNTGKIYAMKEMRKVKIISKRSVHSVMNEKILLSMLKHPFLVNISCSFQNRQYLYLVMDYCNRGDMRYHIGNKRKFKQDEARFFLGCIVVCLEYLHGHKIIHRDLKPQNLVIDEQGYVRVTDLGVSRQVKPNNFEDTSGTPGYMAPQVIMKQNHSYPADYFALGVIAYQFMTGKRPYVGANRKEIRQKMMAKQVKLDDIPPFGWSKESISFINGLIQRRVQDRLGSKGIEQIKNHPFFKKLNWEKLSQRRMPSPFLPETIQQDYHNYKECISEDTQIEDMQQYKLILRHKDTQQAFNGYEYIPRTKKKADSKMFDSFLHTTMSIRKRK